VSRANGAKDMFELVQDKAYANTPATLEVRIFDWFNAAIASNSAFDGISLANFFQTGGYFAKVMINQGSNANLFYQKMASSVPLTSIEAALNVGEMIAAGNDSFDVEIDDWSAGSMSPVELHVIYPIDSLRDEIRLHPAINGTTMEFDFGPVKGIEKAHINQLLNGTNEGNELVPALQFMMANIPNSAGSFTLKMTVTSGSDSTLDVGGLQMVSEVDVSYTGDGTDATFTIPSQVQDVTVTDGSICQSGCTFSLASTGDVLRLQDDRPNYPPTMSAELIALFDLNAVGRNSEATVELQTGDFHLMIEILPEGTNNASTVAGILTYGGLPVQKVEGIIKIK